MLWSVDFYQLKSRQKLNWQSHAQLIIIIIFFLAAVLFYRVGTVFSSKSTLSNTSIQDATKIFSTDWDWKVVGQTDLTLNRWSPWPPYLGVGGGPTSMRFQLSSHRINSCESEFRSCKVRSCAAKRSHFKPGTTSEHKQVSGSRQEAGKSLFTCHLRLRRFCKQTQIGLIFFLLFVAVNCRNLGVRVEMLRR